MPKIKPMMTSEIEQKANEIRKNYGGMLDLHGVTLLLGVKNPRTATRWLADVDAVMVNGRKRWQAADLARKIVASTIPGGRAL